MKAEMSARRRPTSDPPPRFRIPYSAFRTSHGASLVMTPLIDVVFLLIIFFMAAAQFQKEETGDVELPRAVKAETPHSASSVRLTINVVKPDLVEVQGRIIAESDLTQVVRMAARRAGAEPLAVKIRADRDVDFGVVQSILLACAGAKVWKVAFAVMPKRKNEGGKPTADH